MPLERDRYGQHYKTDSYKLRSSGPIPLGRGFFVTQTFGIDHSIIRSYPATEYINNSDAMAGIPGGTLLSANWTRLPYLSQTGRNLFSGTTVTVPAFIDRDELT